MRTPFASESIEFNIFYIIIQLQIQSMYSNIIDQEKKGGTKKKKQKLVVESSLST